MAQSENPFAEHIALCGDDPVKIEELYATTRSTRNVREKARIVDPNFEGWTVDGVLAQLESNPGFIDKRNSVIITASPPAQIKELISDIQQRLRSVAPSLWFTPPENLHITILDVANSKPREEVEEIASIMAKGLPDMARCGAEHPICLIKPVVNLDPIAMALSFVPAAQNADADQYTYHHLRRDLFSIASGTGVTIGSRYFVPSAHVTIARFITQDGFLKTEESADAAQGQVDHARVSELVECVDGINRWLEAEYWPQKVGTVSAAGQWIIGGDSGLECRIGPAWYGGGRDLMAEQADL